MLIFDADGLIKIVHSGIFESIPHTVLISEQVYTETVVQGKEGLYPDAFEIEQLIQKKKIVVKKIQISEEIQGLGTGELSTYALFLKKNADAIVSDDRRFLHFLEQKLIPFIVPTEIIVQLVKKKYITKLAAFVALERLQTKVTKHHYESAITALGGKP